MSSNKVFTFFSSIILAYLGTNIAHSSPLSLEQAEQLALKRSPELKALRAKTQSLDLRTVAAGQLSDPKLILGAMNFPVDTFNIRQEPMTQLQIGVQQSFPRGRSLKYKQSEVRSQTRAQWQAYKNQQILIRKVVRTSWLELYLWRQTKQIVNEQKKIFQHLVKITESMLANNKTQQKDVIRAQLELTELDNKLTNINEKIDIQHAQLRRWLGNSTSLQLNKFPRLKPILLLGRLEKALSHHPQLARAHAKSHAAKTGVSYAEEQYKPGFTLGVTYGFRHGRNITNTPRADFFSAKLNLDLPLFPGNRQRQILNANKTTLEASQQEEISLYRQLNQQLKTQYAIWQRQRARVRLYRSKLLPQAKQYAEATLTAYENTQTDFPTLARAYVRDLQTQLAALNARISAAQAQVNLLYIEGK
jgi:outer membrane protein TolC